MFGRKDGAKATVTETAGTVGGAVADATGAMVDYVDPLAKDEKLRQRLAAAIIAGAGARQRVRRQRGLTGLVRRLAADPVLRAQLIELGAELKGVQKRAKKAHSHKLRNVMLVAGGAGMVAAAIVLRGRHDESGDADSQHETVVPEGDVSVSTA
jgi:hypothetical protein